MQPIAEQIIDRGEFPKEEPLLCVSMEGGKMSFAKHPYDMTFNLIVHEFSIEDMIQKRGDDFKYLMSSGGKHTVTDSKDEAPLLRVGYTKYEQMHPDLITKFQNMDTNVDIELSILEILINRNTVLQTYGFLLNTFVDKATMKGPGHKASPVEVVTNEETLETEAFSDAEESLPAEQESSILVNARLRQVNIVLNNDGLKLAKASLQKANCTIALPIGSMSVALRIGGLNIDDLVSRQPSQKLTKLLTVEGEEVVNLLYEQYDPLASNKPNYDQSLKLTAGALRISFLPHLLGDLIEYLGRFQEMHELFENARQAAADSANEFRNSAIRFHYDIQVQSPIVVLPRAAESTEALWIYFGDLEICNTFVGEENHLESNVANINLYKTRIESKLIQGSTMDTEMLLAEVDINLTMRTFLGGCHFKDLPATKVGSVLLV